MSTTIRVHNSATTKLKQLFDIGITKDSPVFKPLTENTYRQLESGIYNIYGRKLNIDVKVRDENGVWHGEYKDWSHLEEITIRQGFFEYLNALWLFYDGRPNKNLKYWCKETYIFDKKVIVIQQVEHDSISAKILAYDEDIKLYIEDILSFKPMNVVPKREVREINELEHQGLQFGSSQLKINVNTAEEELDAEGFVKTNLDHYDNYTYEVYDSLRNIFKQITITKDNRLIEAQTIWLEEWIDKKVLTNELNSIIPFMSPEVINTIKKYTYKNKNVYDRDTYGYYLFKEGGMKRICNELDIPITIGWDIWKMLNKEIMQNIVEELYRKYPE